MDITVKSDLAGCMGVSLETFDLRGCTGVSLTFDLSGCSGVTLKLTCVDVGVHPQIST